MTITSPMPKLIETKKDLESLIPGEQVQIRTTNSLYRWFVYEETINNKCSFIARYSSENIAEAMNFRATEKGIELICYVDPALPTSLMGDKNRLRQIIVNLAGNAIKFTEQGSVTVRISYSPERRMVHCVVADTGIGIPSADMPRLFEDFFRASNVEIKGTGLGLSISKRIVEAHGGKIWAESPWDGNATGTKFSFTLPKPNKAKRRQHR